MEKKYLVIGGLALLALAFVAGVVFSPSGYIVATKDIACVQRGTGSEPCEGADSYWGRNTFKSRNFCENTVDEYGRGCGWPGYDCSCKLVGTK